MWFLGQFHLSGKRVDTNDQNLLQLAPFYNALIRTQAHRRNGHVGGTVRISMAPMPPRPHHPAAACTDATAHPRRGHHRTTSHTLCSVRSPGRCRPRSQVRSPDTTAQGPRSRFPVLRPTRHTSCCHSTRVGRLSGKVKPLVRLMR
jgi:hypothetical protein